MMYVVLESYVHNIIASVPFLGCVVVGSIEGWHKM
jgi:hypothetical protein